MSHVTNTDKSHILQAGSSVDMTRSEEESLVDGPLISADALHAAIRREFRTVPTACHAVLLSLLHVVYVALSVCMAVMCVLKLGQEEVCASILGPVRGDSAVVFGKAVLWVLVLVFTCCAQHHHSRTRSRGYLRFYRRTSRLKQLPLAVHSTVKVMIFNAERAPPDVSQEEHLHNFSVASLPMETGFREVSYLEEVVEKQADLIEYLKQHNSLLSRRLLNLTAQH
ncbi:transmembrane protein 192 isoform X4 [Phycodurus eques]|uniref:transmembrane protein 192 isoform X4 n=1 Tax=Phycodurus eques TaxID=693459 RepID=UPI002ACE72EB|nr:transmembrane protein 192 isoform X4 [Phycodurus eques]